MGTDTHGIHEFSIIFFSIFSLKGKRGNMTFLIFLFFKKLRKMRKKEPYNIQLGNDVPLG